MLDPKAWGADARAWWDRRDNYTISSLALLALLEPRQQLAHLHERAIAQRGRPRLRLAKGQGLADGVGGAWNQNRYPGCACDVQSYFYLPLLEREQGDADEHRQMDLKLSRQALAARPAFGLVLYSCVSEEGVEAPTLSRMPATAGRARMPHGNRVSSSAALKMTVR